MIPVILFCAFAGQSAAQTAVADVVYVNGPILTMDSRASVAEAVAIRNGEIVAVGTMPDVRKHIGPSTRTVDLKGKVLLPGFYAAHDHFPQQGIAALFQVDLNSPPIGKMETIDDLVAALRERAAKTPEGVWIAGRGYDDTLLRERRHPTRNDLDRASTRHPIVIIHTSGHLSVGNSRALAIAGVTKATPQPKGGVIRKDPTTGEPSGVVEESGILRNRLPAQTDAQWQEAIRWSDRHYLSKGVTTTVIAGGAISSLNQLAAAVKSNDLRLRAVLMLGPAARGAVKTEALAGISPDRLHVTAAKMWHDGSIQGYTGYLSAPYHVQAEGKQDDRGYPAETREELIQTVQRLHRAGYQIAIHGNGDAAIGDILDAYAEAQRSYPRADARHRIEHCQTVREDQLDRMKELGVTPSFFVGHVYYWGDRHRDIFLGPARAARISPLASALRRGIRFTLHDDTPVTPVNPLQLVWGAANRITKAGKILGPDQRIPVLEALRAVTSDAAWQNFEEARKGSLEPGKLADFVILDRNPLTVSPEHIRDIKVLETIVGGVSARGSPEAR